MFKKKNNEVEVNEEKISSVSQDTAALEQPATPSFFKKALDLFIKYKGNIIPYLGLIIAFAAFAILPPFTTGRTIFTTAFWNNYIERSVTLLILSMGAIFIYSMGSMDISVGATAGVASIIMVSINNSTGSMFLGIIVALAFTLGCGLINALVGELLHLPAVIGSIFLMFFNGGIQALFFKNNELPLFGDFEFFKQTWFKIVIVVIFFAITFYLFKFTKLGKYTRGLGANNVVVRQSGVKVIPLKFVAYGFLGLAVVLASFNSVVRVGSVTSGTGGTFHMDIMIALILGGMPLSGGMKSRVSAAVIGTLTFNLLDTGLVLIGVPLELVLFIKSVIIFFIIVVTCRKKDARLLQR